jgi:hypothetical protein
MNSGADSIMVAERGLRLVCPLEGGFEGIGFQREPDCRGGTSPAERFTVRLVRERSLIHLVLDIPRYFVEFPGDLLSG